MGMQLRKNISLEFFFIVSFSPDKSTNEKGTTQNGTYKKGTYTKVSDGFNLGEMLNCS